MKKYIYELGTIALAITLAGSPLVALAENDRVDAQVITQMRAEGASTSASVRIGEGSDTGSKEEVNESSQASSTENTERETGKSGEMMGGQFLFNLEGTTTQAFSLGQLKQSIEMRKQELDDEEASTSPETRDIMKNANPVRLAVHALLASKDLLGGIGGQVSVIAREMNDSVATTTSAEARIQSRGFFTRLLFGGDSAAAEVIAQAVARNQQRINDLTKLLNEANVSADIKATLTAQITALEDAQTRLQALAQKEQTMWGLFSWRF